MEMHPELSFDQLQIYIYCFYFIFLHSVPQTLVLRHPDLRLKFSVLA